MNTVSYELWGRDIGWSVCEAIGMGMRALGLILATVAIAMPAASGTAFGSNWSVSLLGSAPWLAALPVLVFMAVISTRTVIARALDIIAAVLAGIVAGQFVMAYFRAPGVAGAYQGNVFSFAQAPTGFFLVVAAIACLIAATLPSGRRPHAAWDADDYDE